MHKGFSISFQERELALQIIFRTFLCVCQVGGLFQVYTCSLGVKSPLQLGIAMQTYLDTVFSPFPNGSPIRLQLIANYLLFINNTPFHRPLLRHRWMDTFGLIYAGVHNERRKSRQSIDRKGQSAQVTTPEGINHRFLVHN